MFTTQAVDKELVSKTIESKTITANFFIAPHNTSVSVTLKSSIEPKSLGTNPENDRGSPFGETRYAKVM